MDKEVVVYEYNGIPLNHKKEWTIAICSNMDGLGGYYTKGNKSDKDVNFFISLICGM